MRSKRLEKELKSAREVFFGISYPPVVSQFMSAAPDNRKEAVFFSCISPLSVYSTRLRLRYPFDSEVSGCQVHVFVVGDQSAGKAALDSIQRRISSKLLEHDAVERQKETDYENKVRSRSSTQKLPEPPKTCILVLPPSTSRYKICVRASNIYQKYADTLFFYVTTAELGTILDANRMSFSDLRTINRLSYDLDALYGQDHGGEGFSGIVNINTSFLCFGTSNAINNYFNNSAILNGNLSRSIIVEITQNIGDNAPYYKPMSDHDNAIIDTMLEKLMNNIFADDGEALQPTIEQDMSFLMEDILEFQEEAKAEAIDKESWAIDIFRKRASVSAFRIAAICKYLYDISNEILPADERFSDSQITEYTKAIYKYSAYFVLCGILRRYGNRCEKLYQKEKEIMHSEGKHTLIDLLPDVFDKDMLETEIKESMLKTPSRVFISRWIKTGKVQQMDDGRYRKATKL